MNTAAKRTLFWTPRVLCIAFAAFLSLFALDVFDGKHGFWGTVLALVMHLLPTTGLVILVLIVSWRREWIGGVLFNALAVLYIVLFWGKFHWSAYVGISGPLFFVGILFLLNWRYRAQLRPQ